MQEAMGHTKEMIQEQEFFALEEFRSMPDDELLTVWEHTQNMEMELRMKFGHHVTIAPNYEKIILDELQARVQNNIFSAPPVEYVRPNVSKPRKHRRVPQYS